MRSKLVGVAVMFVMLLSMATVAQAKKGEPDKVVVQHILVGFKKSVQGKEISRSRKQARALTLSLMDRIEAGEDFDALVKEYTNDSYPGIMTLINEGARLEPKSTPRKKVVLRFGDVSFRLEVGEVEIANYHVQMSPFGWHIIKRLE
jgi:parvulin-like peptidyl-prolyl isomerase